MALKLDQRTKFKLFLRRKSCQSSHKKLTKITSFKDLKSLAQHKITKAISPTSVLPSLKPWFKSKCREQCLKRTFHLHRLDRSSMKTTSQWLLSKTSRLKVLSIHRKRKETLLFKFHLKTSSSLPSRESCAYKTTPLISSLQRMISKRDSKILRKLSMLIKAKNIYSIPKL